MIYLALVNFVSSMNISILFHSLLFFPSYRSQATLSSLETTNRHLQVVFTRTTVDVVAVRLWDCLVVVVGVSSWIFALYEELSAKAELARSNFRDPFEFLPSPIVRVSARVRSARRLDAFKNPGDDSISFQFLFLVLFYETTSRFVKKDKK